MLEEPFAWLEAWALTEPIALRPTGRGINNRTFFVDTPAGTRFLRIYVNTRDPARVRYEHEILRALAGQSLSFAVPKPVETRDGGTFATLPGGELAALFDLIPGEPPGERDRAYLRECGVALGELHGALRAIATPASPEVAAQNALERIHPLVPDPWSIDDAIVRVILGALRPAIPRLYASLPVQLCHHDFFPVNTLQIRGRLTGVLDFEFVGPNLRAVDLVPCLLFGPSDGRTADERLGHAAAFLDGYRRHGDLTQAEARALPTLARLTRATHLIHWFGRDRAGLDPGAHHRTHIERLVELDQFLAAHGGELIALAGG
jgi:homoserine kinase type II